MAKLLKFERVVLVEPRANGFADDVWIDPTLVESVEEVTVTDFYGEPKLAAIINGGCGRHVVHDSGRTAAAEIETQKTTQVRDAAAVAADPAPH